MTDINEEEMLKKLAAFIREEEVDEHLGLPSHILANIMWSGVAHFVDNFNDLNDYFDAVNEQLLQEQAEGD